MGCCLDEGDILDRSALYYAAVKNNYEIAKLIIKEKANPFFK